LAAAEATAEAAAESAAASTSSSRRIGEGRGELEVSQLVNCRRRREGIKRGSGFKRRGIKRGSGFINAGGGVKELKGSRVH
jgi:hypothetical protein